VALLSSTSFSVQILDLESEPDCVGIDLRVFTKQAGSNKDLTFSDRGFEQHRKFLGDAAKR
jgi:hypothetical protein